MRRGLRDVTVAAGVLPFASPGHAEGVAGKWNAEFETPVGLAKYVFDLAQAGDEITGTASFERVSMGSKGQVQLLEGKLTGDKVFFVETLDMIGTPVRVEYRGPLMGDEIAFTRKVGDLQPFVAHRAKK